MNRPVTALTLSVMIAATVGATEPPNADEIVARTITALGGDGFEDLGVLKLQIIEEQTRNDGTASTKEELVYVDTDGLDNIRMEMEYGVVIARNGDDGWASDKGVLDERPQTPFMAKGTVNQTVFPLLVPFSLQMDGVWVKEVAESTWEGKDVWILLIPFAKGFFVSPVLSTMWRVIVDRNDYSILAFDFLPPVELRDVQPMGIRYRILKYEEIDNVKIPSWILSVGMNSQGMESGATRVTKITPSVYGPWEAGLFVSPARLDALENDGPDMP